MNLMKLKMSTMKKSKHFKGISKQMNLRLIQLYYY